MTETAHPDPEVLAAYVKGRSVGAAHAETCEHLRLCDDCRAEVVDIAIYCREEAVTRHSARVRSVRQWFPAGFAAAAAVAMVFVVAKPAARHRDPIGDLVHAAPQNARSIEPRVSGGFAWAPLRTPTRSVDDTRTAEELQFLGTAGAVLQRTKDDSSLEASHAAALAHLFAGQPREASARLRQIAPRAHDAAVWTDLAAAAYMEGVDTGDTGRLQEALVAADTALALNARLPEALFNRALVLESLDAHDLARAAWERYLTVDRDSPWAAEARHHLAALRTRGESRDELRRLPSVAMGAYDQQTALASAARRAIRRGDWALSGYFLNAALAESSARRDDAGRAEILLMRARIRARTGHAADAVADLTEARAVVERITDARSRLRAQATCRAVASELARSPAEMLRLSNDALAHVLRTGMRDDVADLHLTRGRALVALGRAIDAATDFEAGMQTLDAGDRRTRLGEPPAGLFDAGWGWDRMAVRTELYDEAIALALARAHPRDAFAYAERARRPESREWLVSTPPVLDDVLIEYASLRNHLVIFVITDGSIRTVEQPVTRSTLSWRRDQLLGVVQAGDTARFRDVSARLYLDLIAPIEHDIASRDRLIIVPDTTLTSVPFAALVSRSGHYLVERHTVVMAPSAAVAAYEQNDEGRSTAAPRLLLLASPVLREGAFAPLAAARREATDIAALYGRRSTCLTAPVDAAGIERLAAAADIIHFAGHAVSPEDDANAALLIGDARVTATEIAAMRLERARLVVLASCSTARDSGEGEPSLVRAFLDAGADAVIGTLWDIGDGPAAEFFPRLHFYLAKGQSPADALRATQLELMRRNDGRSSMWAAVEVFTRGADRTKSRFGVPHSVRPLRETAASASSAVPVVRSSASAIRGGSPGV